MKNLFINANFVIKHRLNISDIKLLSYLVSNANENREAPFSSSKDFFKVNLSYGNTRFVLSKLLKLGIVSRTPDDAILEINCPIIQDDHANLIE